MSPKKIESKRKHFTTESRLESRGHEVGIDFVDKRLKAPIWIKINPKNLNRSLPGDLIKVKYRYIKKQGEFKGWVVEILKRTRKPIVATVVFEFDEYYYKLEGKTATKRYYLMDKRDISDVYLGQRVLIRFKKWERYQSYPVAELMQRLDSTRKSAHRNHIFQMVLDYGFYDSFPQKVLDEIESLKPPISSKEIKKRMDFRDVLTFTIDQETSKDLDDAISFKELSNATYQIGIHIADVTHYVSKDSTVDREAYNRGTSVYFIDQVIPMLPEILSNDLCSLNPSEDKLTFSVVFEITSEGKVMDQQFAKTIIHSNRRLFYQEVQGVIDENKGAGQSRDTHANGISNPLKKALLVLHKITQNLRLKRINEGSLIIPSEEVKFEVDQDANPTQVTVKIQNQAQQLIEELMLLANKTVAEFLSLHRYKTPAVYRIHDVPSMDGLEQISKRLKSLGIQINTNPNTVKSHLNSSMVSLSNTPHAYWLSSLITKAMSKAQYSTENIGHYGLGFEKYTHFTSPIRRYPDVMVHRILNSILFNQKKEYKDLNKLEQFCQHTNFKELNALKLEREVQKLMQCLYALQLKQKGGTYKGYVSGLSRYGMFVELIESRCQGMVFFREVPHANYSFIENQWTIEKRKRRKVVEIGDLLDVNIGKVSLERRLIDFHFIQWISQKQ